MSLNGENALEIHLKYVLKLKYYRKYLVYRISKGQVCKVTCGLSGTPDTNETPFFQKRRQQKHSEREKELFKYRQKAADLELQSNHLKKTT